MQMEHDRLRRKQIKLFFHCGFVFLWTPWHTKKMKLHKKENFASVIFDRA